ncbi:MAG: DUF983 domain-containing protein [Sphingopyxis sp.]|nr:DUF983 domain-containing protein [Sphingopyxis sp.]
MQTPLDRSYRADRARKSPILANRGNPTAEGAELPVSAWEAMLRGARGRCPRCDDAKLFDRFLKPAGICPACEQDWTHQQADDFPAYVAILLTGHIMAPVIIALVQETKLSLTSLAAIIVTAMLVLMIAFLQPAKGAIIALQWWFGMHGFVKERRAPKKAGRDE